MAGLRRRGLLLGAAWSGAAAAGTPPPDMPARLARLVAAYPDHLAGIEGEALVWRDGTRMPTGAALPARAFAEMLRDATLADQLRQDYPAGAPAVPPPPGESPGRLRHTAFFRKMYGDCRVPGFAAALRPVAWMPRRGGQRLPVTTVNDVAGRLERVVAALEALPAPLQAFLTPSSGSFNCRAVADTGLPSMHGYGAAIDIAVARADYWAWSRGPGAPTWRNRIPIEIVACFEAERFAWGGRWADFDTMHFEYRPELFA
jgi:hypothetical protein